MPNILRSNESTAVEFSPESTNYDYKYPGDIDLKPGSEVHTYIKNTILEKVRESRSMTEKRFSGWRQMDRKMTGYIDLTKSEEDVKDVDERKPVSVVFPYTYALVDTFIAYMVAAFLPEPIFRYEGISPEDTVGTILMEKVIGVHCNKNKVGINLHTMFRDIGVYGFGVVAPTWRKKYGYRTRKQPTGMFGFLQDFIQTGFQKISQEELLFEGNELQNIDPYRYFPDPNVAVHEVQKMEYVGWMEDTNIYNLMRMEEETDTDLFNVEYVKHVQNKRSIYSTDRTDRTKKWGGEPAANVVTQPTDVIHMYFKLIPRMWGLHSGENVEKWLFSLAADDVLIRAQPLNLDHNMFPVAVAAPDFDGYSSTAQSSAQLVYGMQEILDWMLNSHVANVRKAINDMIIVDPYLVNIKDMKDPKPGKLIRLRRPAWGRGVSDVAQQLNVNDITRGNVGDAMLMMQYMNQVTGSNSPMQGNLRGGGPERLTAREFQGTAQGAISRLERTAKMIGLQSMQDIGTMFAYNAQQLMSQETYVKIVGSFPERIMKNMGVQEGKAKVTPYDILVDFDMMIRDGSVPGGNFSDAWNQLFQILASQPELAQQFDMVRIFKHIARNLGAKNVEEFERQGPQAGQASIQPDQAIEDGVSAGNVVPFQAGGLG